MCFCLIVWDIYVVFSRMIHFLEVCQAAFCRLIISLCPLTIWILVLFCFKSGFRAFLLQHIFFISSLINSCFTKPIACEIIPNLPLSISEFDIRVSSNLCSLNSSSENFNMSCKGLKSCGLNDECPVNIC